MSNFKRTRWKEGMVFGVPLDDGSFGIVQAIGLLHGNIVHIAVFSTRFNKLPTEIQTLDKNEVISLSATWKQDLNNGTWAKIGILQPCVKKTDFPNQKLADTGSVGIKHSDAGLFSKFLSSFHGLRPWNVMYKQDYWDSYLNCDTGRPDTAIILSANERSAYRRNIMGIEDA